MVFDKHVFYPALLALDAVQVCCALSISETLLGVGFKLNPPLRPHPDTPTLQCDPILHFVVVLQDFYEKVSEKALLLSQLQLLHVFGKVKKTRRRRRRRNAALTALIKK